MDELAAIKDVPAFMSFAEAMSTNPFLSLLAGTIMTGAVQASAATIRCRSEDVRSWCTYI